MKRVYGAKNGRLLFMAGLLAFLLSFNGIFNMACVGGEGNAHAMESESGIGEVPGNPKHHCTLGERGQWSYVYFGSYPQTEVTDSETIGMIEKAIPDSGSVAGEGVDAEVADGVKTKYRRIGKGDAEDFRFKETEYRYFKYEPIKWKVLWNDGKTLFVIADAVLDSKVYHETDAEVTWETCTLRKWLNGYFCETAFTDEERGAIVKKEVENQDNPNPDPRYHTDGGNDTRDLVYLPSLDETLCEAYGFCREKENSETRIAKENDFSYVRGQDRMGKGNANWWLRSPGYHRNYAASIDSWGKTNQGGEKVTYRFAGICPMLNINLASNSWKVADNGGYSEVDGKAMLENPVHTCVWDDVTSWDYVYFGTFPQTEVLDDDLIGKIDEAVAAAGSDGTEEFIDVEVPEGSNQKYRRLHKEGYVGEEYRNYRYFKFEPIRWRVLQNEGETLFLRSDVALEHEKSRGLNEWDRSGIRTWLNGDFYSLAFSEKEREAIVEHEVVPDSVFGGEKTKDKLYTLSIAEASSEMYGFCKDDTVDSPSRQTKASDYAQARDVYAFAENRHCCDWGLRSPGTLGYNSCVSDDGSVLNSYNTNNGICPVLHVQISSDAWSMAGRDPEFTPREQSLSGLRINKIKTEYVQGEAWDISDLSVTALYHGAARVLSSEEYTVKADGVDMSVPGEYRVGVSYAEDGITVKGGITIVVRQKGDAGDSGNAGNAGDAGNSGNTGNSGDAGNGGDAGNSGDTGNSGNGGDAGNSGNAGNTGDSGNQGEDEKIVLIDLRVAKGKTEYIQGEKLNVDDLTVSAIYKKSEVTLAPGKYVIDASAIHMDVPGTYPLEVSYTENSISVQGRVSITVKKKTVENSVQKGLARGQRFIDQKTKGEYVVVSSGAKGNHAAYVKPTKSSAAIVVIPATVTVKGFVYQVTEISRNCFKNNKRLRKATLGKNISVIGDRAFYRCTALKKLSVPAKVGKIGKQAFCGCKKLRAVNIKTKKLNKKNVGSGAFKNIYKKAVIRVPKSKYSSYKKMLRSRGMSAKGKVRK